MAPPPVLKPLSTRSLRFPSEMMIRSLQICHCSYHTGCPFRQTYSNSFPSISIFWQFSPSNRAQRPEPAHARNASPEKRPPRHRLTTQSPPNEHPRGRPLPHSQLRPDFGRATSERPTARAAYGVENRSSRMGAPRRAIAPPPHAEPSADSRVRAVRLSVAERSWPPAARCAA